MTNQHKPVVLDDSGLDLSPDEVRELLSSPGDIEQGTDGWFEERLGKVTASAVKEVVARDRYGQPYKGYYDYMIELAVERVTGNRKRFSSRYTDHGHEYEGFVAALYQEMHPDAEIREVGFMEHPTLAAGASCDRLVDDDGTLEIKAPNTDTMIRYMVSMIDDIDDPNYDLVKLLGLKGGEWRYYYEQIQMQLWINGRKWCDFCVGDPFMPENAQIVVKRVERDDDYINRILEPRVTGFLVGVARLERYLLDFNVNTSGV